MSPDEEGFVLLQEIQALIAALNAHDWTGAFVLAVAITREVYLDLTKKGQQPHVLRMQAHVAATTVEGIASELEECCGAGFDPGKLLALLALLMKLLLPLIIGG